MGVLNRESQEIHAKIAYVGPEGSGKTTNLEFIQRKLKKSQVGELQTDGNGSAGTEALSVRLGKIRDFSTYFELQTIPSSPETLDRRREIVATADGIVFVADLRPEHHDATADALEELESILRERDLDFDDVMIVVQYNHRDEVDENALDGLCRRLGLDSETSFEACAKDGTGVLQSLTTLSKLVLAKIRHDASATAVEASAAKTVIRETEQAPVAVDADIEEAVQSIEDTTLDALTPLPPEKSLRVESAGPVEGTDAELVIPIRLLDDETGRSTELRIRVSIGES